MRLKIFYWFLPFLIVSIAIVRMVMQFRTPEIPDEHLPYDIKHTLINAWNFDRLKDPYTDEIPANARIGELEYAASLPETPPSRESTYDYQLRGPYNVGGRIRAVSYDASNPSVILAGGVSGGIWRSMDGGLSWANCSGPDDFINISCLTQDKRAGKTHIWYYGTGESTGNSASKSSSAHYYGNGLYKSTDGGKTWNHLSATGGMDPRNPGEWSAVRSMAVDNSNTTQDEVYAATNGIIKRSLDGGTTWSTILGTYNSGTNYSEVAVTSGGVVYATIQTGSGGTGAGIWRSTTGDPGSFVQILASGLISGYQRIVIGIAPSNENVVYFLARTPGQGRPADPNQPSGEAASLLKYTYVSGNGSGTGGSWVNRSSAIPSDINAYRTFDTQGNYNMCIAVKPDNENVVFIGSTNVFRSNNGFATSGSVVQVGGYTTSSTPGFFTYRYPNHHPDAHAFAFHPSSSSTLINATDGGLHMTNDCQASSVVWSDRNSGLVTTQFYTVALDHTTENQVVCGGLQDNGTQWTNFNSTSSNWKNPLMSDGSYCAVHNGTDNAGAGYYCFSSQNGATYRYQLNGSGELATSSSLARIDPALSSGAAYSFINPFVLDYNNNNIMYMAYYNSSGAKILRNTSIHLIPINGNLSQYNTNWYTMNFTGSGYISTLTSSITNPSDRLYIGTSNGGVYRVENASTTFTVKDISSGFEYRKGTYVSDIAVHPLDANKILLVFSNYNVYSVYYSGNGGDSWQPVAGNLEEPLASGIPPTQLGLGKGLSIRSCKIVWTPTGDVYLLGAATGLFATDSLAGINTVWLRQSKNLIGNAVVDKMDYRPSDGTVVMATHGNGVYQVVIDSPDGITSIDSKNSEQTQRIIKAYPNPTKGKTTIDVQKTGCMLTVFDVKGKLHFATRLKAKSQNIDLSSLASGIYSLVVRQGDNQWTEKLVIEGR